MIFVHAINFILVLFLWIFIWTLFNKVVTKLNITDEDFKFIGADKITGAPIAYKNTYAVDGGISELFLLYSQKLTHNISGGIKYSLLFGNQSSNDELYTYDVQFSTF